MRVSEYLSEIDRLTASGIELAWAARLVHNRDRALSLAVVDVIGAWPASDPRLRALQRVWFGCEGTGADSPDRTT